MQPLYAPWRVQYLRGPKPVSPAGEIFKRIAESSDDAGNYVVVREKSCYAVLNTYPYCGGHLLVVPYTQTPDLNGLSEQELEDLIKLTRRCQNALSQVMKPDGFNIGINLGRSAGMGVSDHVHVHVVPRWSGDTNFMPVIANTTVLSEALADVAARLRTELAKESAHRK